MVHLSGMPKLWAVEEILRRAPNLKTLQVLPKMRRHLPEHSPHVQLLNVRGVKLVEGYDRPELAWGEGEVRDLRYPLLRQKLLKPELRTYLDELCDLGFEMAIYTRRYFCLNDEQYMPYRELSAERGLHVRQDHGISAYVNGVIHVLDPTYEVNQRSLQFARTFVRRIEKARRLRGSAEAMGVLLKELGIIAWPHGLPLARLEAYEKVLVAWRSNQLAALSERERAVLVNRFGLGDCPVGTFAEIGAKVALSRERVRQIEGEALEKLGVDSSLE
jgi:hypothetical protein